MTELKLGSVVLQTGVPCTSDQTAEILASIFARPSIAQDEDIEPMPKDVTMADISQAARRALIDVAIPALTGNISCNLDVTDSTHLLLSIISVAEKGY